ncbi:hypothetical protein OS493_039014 [Desmophyllum pertusum]|uniref:FATC domain-containing protein n=1 Tax=Desmophyllum pertusum TaxID=174260 RepID=A0A9W9YHA3_9CNID|nr:hypothetical protein OS493_039014 [Desmophyllum pertusum]
MGLHNLIGKLKKWIKISRGKGKTSSKERCRFLSNFTTIHSRSGTSWRVSHAKGETRIAHTTSESLALCRELNLFRSTTFLPGVCTSGVTTERNPAKDIFYLPFHVFVAVSPQMRLIEDNPSFISLREILTERCDKKHVESDAPIALYYERLASVQSRGWSGGLTSSLFNWLCRVSPSSHCTLQRLGPGNAFKIAQDSGRLTISYSRFEVDDSKDLAQYEGGETKVTTLIAAATSPDNLCRMDPAWHPWL